MIVPLSLGVQLTDSPACESNLYEECAMTMWLSSFGRIPSALFSFDTRVTNTIYLARKSSESPSNRSDSRLDYHRWFEVSASRYCSDLGLSYASFSPSTVRRADPKVE